MAVLFSATSSLWTDSLWKTVDATSYLNSEAASTATTTTYVASSTFTPGAITVEGILLKVKGRTGSSGTFSVQLWNSTDSAQVDVVTCNVTDITNDDTTYDGGWCYFKFALAQTLTAGKNYSVRILSSVNASVTVYRNATANNWSRGLVTSTTASLIAADTIIITGDITAAATTAVNTIIHNLTATTSYASIEVGAYGKWIGQNSASTNYNITVANSGFITVAHNGVIEFSTSSSRLPSDSTFTITCTCTSNAQNGIRIRNYGTFRAYGTQKTRKAKLTADASAGATSLTTDISTGWKNGDLIFLAGVGSGGSTGESKSLTADAVGTTLTIAAIATFKGGNTTTKVQSDIINVTSNFKLLGSSASLGIAISSARKPIIDLDNIEIQYISGWENFNITTGSTINIKQCSIRSNTGGANGRYLRFGEPAFGTSITGGSITLDEIVMNYPAGGIAVNASNSSTSYVTITNCVCLASFTYAFLIAGAVDVSNCISTNNENAGFVLTGYSTSPISNLTCYTSGGEGISFRGFQPAFPVSTSSGSLKLNITNLLCWRNAVGLQFNSDNSGYQNQNLVLDGVELFGNTTANILFNQGTQNCTLKNLVANGGTTVVAQYGISLGTFGIKRDIIFENSSFGVTTAHSVADINAASNLTDPQITFRDCQFGTSTLLSNQNNLSTSGELSFARFNTTASLHRIYKKFGTITTDSTIYNTSLRSQRMTPNNASYKLTGSPIYIPLTNGAASTISVAVRSSVVGDGTAYNGNFPRLIIAANPVAGSAFDSDIVAATATLASTGSWETLSYTTPVPTDNAIVTAYIDCDGTTGWVNWDTVNLGTGTSSIVYYNEAEPYILPPTTGSITLGGERSYTFVS